MARLSPNMSVVILNLSEVNTPIKTKLSDWIKKKLYASYRRHTLNTKLQKDPKRKV